jgi:gliding motility-associated-like protein
VSKPPTTCKTKLTKTIESFSPPLVGITCDSTFCHGLATTLKAYGAWDYTWGDNSKADSIVVKPPGGIYKLIGRSSTGCVSDTVYKTVKEDPDWQLINQSDTTRCPGDGQTILAMTGAETYRWDTGDNTSSIVVRTPGTWSVTGTNSRGCKKSKDINVKEYPLPAVDFKTSSTLLDTQHNTLTCSISAESGVTYSWDMGDETTERGPTAEHTYNLTSKIQSYTVKLTAKNLQDCTNTASAVVDVLDFFVPNVFSPNGDGINDVFMPDIDLQIFDRNGLVLYRGNAGWDGNYNGRLMEPDTYFYLIRYTDSK